VHVVGEERAAREQVDAVRGDDEIGLDILDGRDVSTHPDLDPARACKQRRTNCRIGVRDERRAHCARTTTRSRRPRSPATAA
jgi:hypothetical protein